MSEATAAIGPDEMRDHAAAVIALQPLARLLGFEVLSCHAGRAEMALTLREDHRQQHGYVHGGVIGALADSACAMAALSLVGDNVTAEYKINFLTPAIGERLFARAVTIKATRRLVVLTCDCVVTQAGAETLAAVVMSTFVTRSRRRPEEGAP